MDETGKRAIGAIASILPATSKIASSAETWFTECTGYLGNTLGPKGFSSGSRLDSSSPSRRQCSAEEQVLCRPCARK